MKIMAVGDLHGNWGALNTLINNKQPNIVLQCGDFGHWKKLEVVKPVLYGRQSSWFLQGVKTGDNCQVYWCDGNHEQYDHLLTTPKDKIDYKGVTYMPRGSTMQLPDGRTVMFIGGADSIDKDQRTIGVDWFPEELITHRDLDKCLAFNGKVDIVISHTCPTEFKVKSANGSEGKYNDPSRKALSVVLERFRPDLWLYGHYHRFQRGQHQNTRWTCLDYPGHGGTWWAWI